MRRKGALREAQHRPAYRASYVSISGCSQSSAKVLKRVRKLLAWASSIPRSERLIVPSGRKVTITRASATSAVSPLTRFCHRDRCLQLFLDWLTLTLFISPGAHLSKQLLLPHLIVEGNKSMMPPLAPEPGVTSYQVSNKPQMNADKRG